MKTDDQVLEEATGIVENQWCQRTWFNPITQQYCAMGAVERAVGTVVTHFESVRLIENDDRKVDQVVRIAQRLWEAIAEQYPGYPETVKSLVTAPDPAVYGVEIFNDSHAREEMLAIFEKARAE